MTPFFCLALGSHTSKLTSDELVTLVGTAAAVVPEEAIVRGALARSNVPFLSGQQETMEAWQ